MSDFLDLPTLIIIGVAIVVLLRLRSVLGTRTGNERPPATRIRNNDTNKPDNDDTVVPLRPGSNDDVVEDSDESRRARKMEAEIERYSLGNKDLAKGLAQIVESDASFSPKIFLEGAKSAYEMIVIAFAQGDRRALKNLLEKDVYDGFDSVITARENEKLKVDYTFVGLPKVEISEAGIEKRIAQITIRFNAEVVSATFNSEGELVAGDAEQVVANADEWTFARSLRSRDPNWKLVATDQLD